MGLVALTTVKGLVRQIVGITMADKFNQRIDGVTAIDNGSKQRSFAGISIQHFYQGQHDGRVVAAAVNAG